MEYVQSTTTPTKLVLQIPILSYEGYVALFEAYRLVFMPNLAQTSPHPHTLGPIDVVAQPTDRLAPPSAVRAWATAHGIPVGTRGRLPKRLIRGYLRAEQGGDP